MDFCDFILLLFGFGLLSRAEGCNQLLDQNGATMTSPNYPRDYPDASKCTYTIQAPVDKMIQVTFHTFNLEDGTDCSYDSLKVYDGLSPSVDNLQQTLCGQRVSFVVHNSGNEMLLVFKSDTSISRTGFKADVIFLDKSILAPTDETVADDIFTTQANGIDYEYGNYATTPLTVPDCYIYVNSDEQISSPNYPDDYGNNVLCLYRVEAPVGHVITVDFLRFAVWYDRSCRYDSLKVYDGDQLVDTLCGFSIPRQIRSTGTSLKMIFRSNSYYSTSGFLANVRIIPDSVSDSTNVPTYANYPTDINEFTTIDPAGCSQLFNQTGATMTSPNYPDYYPDLSYCTYTIRAPSNKMIRLTFHTFSLESHSDCIYDSLKVYAGLSPSVDNLQQTLCGHRESFVVRNSGNEMLLVFKSDASIGRTGFRADVIFLDKSILAPTDETVSDYVFTTQANDCYIYVNSDEQISSPNYPDNYGNNVLCLYRVEAPVGHVITVDFLHLAVYYDRSCRYDSLKVYDGDQLVDTLCGYSIPRQIRSTGTSLKMIFRSNSYYSRSGFLANVRIIPDSVSDSTNVPTYANYPTDINEFTTIDPAGCSQLFNQTGATMTSPNYPDYYPNLSYCTYTIRAPSNKMIRLTFHTFSLESHSDCSFDSLKVYAGLSPSVDNLQQTLCGQRESFVVRNSGNEMLLVFKSDTSVRGTGFKADVIFLDKSILAPTDETVSDYVFTTQANGKDYEYGNYATTPLTVPDCYIYVNSDEQISSPNYPDNYGNNVLCLYRVEAPVGHVITVDFLHLAVYYDRSCRYDSLKVYDGDQLVDTLCGYSIPRQIRTTGTSLKMIFRSDYHYSTSGFLANVRIIPDSVSDSSNVPTYANYPTDINEFTTIDPAECNQLLDQNGATMTSPNYPKDYPNLSKCTYTIQAPVDKMIQLTFHTFNLEDHTECSYDSLKVYAGLSPSVDNLQQTLCGHRESFVVRNSGNEMLLVFKSDTIVGRTGFRADVIFLDKSILAPTDETVSDYVFTTQANGIDYKYGNYATTPLTVPDCYIYVSSSDEQISSPNFPDVYGNNVLCLYRVEAPVGHVITVDFFQFAVQYDRYCRYDSLKVYDGDQLVDTLCGFSIPRQIRTTGTSLKMIFRSNSYYSTSGFLANVRIIPDSDFIFSVSDSTNVPTYANYPTDINEFTTIDPAECNQLLDQNGATMTSPNYPKDYPNLSKCTYTIQAPVDKMIQLTFHTFNLEDHTECSYDSLKVYAGLSPSVDNLQQTLCGHRESFVVRNSGNEMLLVFKSDASVGRTGFRADVIFLDKSILAPTDDADSEHFSTSETYRIYDEYGNLVTNLPDCFAYISSDDAEISPTTSYVDYERHSHCYYYVTKSVGHVVMVDLLEYEWEYHSSCLYDSIEVLNDTEIWSSVCGYSIPRQIQTTGFIYGFVINSDGVISRSGPVANVTTIPDSVFDSTELPTYANYATDINGFIDVEDNTCPHEWHYFDQSCYFIKTSAGEFLDAERYCGSHGGQLVSIHSDKEQRFIYSLLTSDVQSYYIGMRLYIDKDGYDGWQNTDSTAINYTNWYPGMPDGGKHEDCVEIYYYHEGKWNDVSCRSSLNGAVCKADIDTVLSTHTVPQSVPTMTHCKDGWTSYYSDNYYCFMENEQIWSAASRACERIGGHLLQVNSSYENEFIWTTMESIDAEFVWLGITDQADEGVWVTDDMRTPPEYTNWDSWEPNNLHNEDCAVMFLHWTGNLRRGAWYDNPCCHEFPFICEK
ncbi:cubilin-like isoform X6 [Apostichopus japonicus]|uniref:cubilin-like isoform X6 n=1 Tax=Stichopus japonicus TaxID=307972 RepID=UPI003AB85E7E